MSWHIMPLKCSSWNITLWTKRAHQSTNVQIFEGFNESSPSSSCQFWNHKVKFYSNFASLFSVMKDNSSALFYLKLLYFGQKELIQAKFSDFWVAGWKFTKFFISCLKLQVSFSLNFASLFSVIRDNSSVFFNWNCTWFGQKERSKVQNFRLSTAYVKFHQICTLIDSFC